MEHERHVERIHSEERLRRGHRLRSPRDFSRAYQRGRRVGGQFLTITYTRRAGEPEPTRVGVVAGKRVGGAVVRNRVKRRLREALRRELPQVSAGWDLVCGAKPPAAEAPYPALVAELHVLLVRAGVLAGPAMLPSPGQRDADDRSSSPASEPRENRSKQP